MNVITIFNSYFHTNTYIFELNRKTYVIDPGNNISRVISTLNSKKIDYILLTHGHMDHIYGVKELVNKYKCKVFASNNDLNYINGNYILDPDFDKNNYDFKYCDYSEFNNKDIEIINTPGHSKGSICIYIKSKNIIFSGDTLFRGSFGRTDLYEGDFEDLKKSISNLFLLYENIIIYPGHGPKTTIKDEKLNNIIKFYKNL